MREIKFRAWDRGNGKMSIPFKIGDRYITFSDHRDYVHLWQHIPHIEIMQYTGLKDKNGKEIYEGDIIELGSGERGAVEYGACWCTAYRCA